MFDLYISMIYDRNISDMFTPSKLRIY